MTEQEKIEIQRAIQARLSIIGGGRQSTTSGSQHSEVNYWEKTVEWVFAKKYFKPNSVLAPLSSTAEAAGDAMVSFCGEDRWLLIEFKRTKADFKAERNKYPVFGNLKKWETVPQEKVNTANRAFTELTEVWRLIKSLDMLPPHILVYGHMVLDASTHVQSPATGLAHARTLMYGEHTLNVAAQSYWGEWCNHKSTSLDIPDGTTVNLDDLKSLGWQLSKFKDYVRTLLAAKCVDGSMDGSGWMYDTVLAVARDGTTKTLSMVEFAQNHLLIGSSPNGNPPPQPVNSGKKMSP